VPADGDDGVAPPGESLRQGEPDASICSRDQYRGHT
jgi:hypothetical protein